MKKVVLVILLGLFCIALYFAYSYYQRIEVLSSYAAKNLCTCLFAAERPLENIKAHDLNYSPINLAKFEIDQERKMVTASVFGLHKKSSVFKGKRGCISIHGNDDYKELSSSPEINSEAQPFISPLKTNTDLSKVVDQYFDKPESKNRSILVLKNDTLLYERYGDGLNEYTPQLGWSMTKSITNALIGVAMKKGLINVNDKDLFPEWADDQRNRITLQHLLQMNSGLKWEEDYEKITDATEMLFLSEDVIESVVDNELEFPPTFHWEYNSGSTNLILGVLRNRLGDDYHEFAYKELFAKIGMTTAFIETDESGNMVGSSFGYASARDWARFGLLYLNEGKTRNGKELLPFDWVNYTSRPVNMEIPHYGSQWWLNDRNNKFKDVPADLFYASGYMGQYVFVIPSEDLVIVRLGLSKNIDLNNFLKDVIEAVKN